MSEQLLQGHLFLDGYGASQTDAESVPAMQNLLQQVNAEAFRGIGKLRIIPVLGDEKPRNNGLSGIILAPAVISPATPSATAASTLPTFSHPALAALTSLSSCSRKPSAPRTSATAAPTSVPVLVGMPF